MGADEKRIVQGCVFAWNAQKAEGNLKKHGVSFLEASDVLFDPYYYAEDASVEGEERCSVIGYSKKNRLLCVVVRDEANEAWRIISARPATPQERTRYEKESDSC